MCKKDLIIIYSEVTLKQYWIKFLKDGWALKMIKKMKKSTNKTLYKDSLSDLLNKA